MVALRRWGAFFLLTASLLLLQQAGLRHALHHALEKDPDQAAHTTLCKECLTQCVGDKLVTPGVTTLSVDPMSFEWHRIAIQAGHAQGLTLPYQSRAPPHGSV